MLRGASACSVTTCILPRADRPGEPRSSSARLYGLDHPRARVDRALRTPAWTIARRRRLRVLSRDASALALRARLLHGPGCCCSTSRSRASTTPQHRCEPSSAAFERSAMIIAAPRPGPAEGLLDEVASPREGASWPFALFGAAARAYRETITGRRSGCCGAAGARARAMKQFLRARVGVMRKTSPSRCQSRDCLHDGVLRRVVPSWCSLSPGPRGPAARDASAASSGFRSPSRHPGARAHLRAGAHPKRFAH